jgi:hypothetical protein
MCVSLFAAHGFGCAVSTGGPGDKDVTSDVRLFDESEPEHRGYDPDYDPAIDGVDDESTQYYEGVDPTAIEPSVEPDWPDEALATALVFETTEGPEVVFFDGEAPETWVNAAESFANSGELVSLSVMETMFAQLEASGVAVARGASSDDFDGVEYASTGACNWVFPNTQRLNSHILSLHVGKTDRELLQRLGRWGAAGVSNNQASTYLNRQDAVTATQKLSVEGCRNGRFHATALNITIRGRTGIYGRVCQRTSADGEPFKARCFNGARAEVAWARRGIAYFALTTSYPY